MILGKPKIKSLEAREILDSKGTPTIEVSLGTDFGVFVSSVPSGVSTGKYEATELRDEDGGVGKAIKNIKEIILPKIGKEGLTDQKKIDEIMISLDGTKNKSRLGANATLAVSIAVLRAGAGAKKIPLYSYISQLSGEKPKLPLPSFNMIEGGKHGDSGLAFQEFMVVPQGGSFNENLEIGSAIYAKLREVLGDKFGRENVRLSAEGAFSVPAKEVSEALDLIFAAATKAGHESDVKFAIDAAATSFFENGGYKVDGNILNKGELANLYLKLTQQYPINSFEDPFEEEDLTWFPRLIEEAIVFGDDLLVSNVERIKLAKEKNTCNGLLLKPNQTGTVSETIEAAKLARSYGWKIMVSNRAGETEDSFIADLAAGLGADFIKSGAPYPKERMAKYNRLLEIEKQIHG